MNFLATLSAAFSIAISLPAFSQAQSAPDKDKAPWVKSVSGKLGLYNSITVEVENLSHYTQPGQDTGKFTLYLDSRPLHELNARLAVDSNKIIFDIRRTPESKEAWDALLGRPFSRQHAGLNKNGNRFFPDYVTGVPVSVGYANERPIQTTVKAYPLVLINGLWALVFLLLLIGTVIVFIILARKTNLLRDSCPELPTRQRPYSLGNAQMAFWMFAVAIAYACILLTTGEHESIPGSILVLLGISSATALSARAVENSKTGNATTKRQAFEIEKSTLETAVKFLKEKTAGNNAAAEAAAKEESEKSTRLNQVTGDLNTLQRANQPQISEGFWQDILSDNQGMSMHRFQIVVWTGVMGITFAVSIYNTLAMPVFNETLLTLMGISNGTYLGFKFPEKQG